MDTRQRGWLRASHLRLGSKGEKLARRLAKELGMKVLCCNYRISGGEIDIVALDGDTICFVEVKTRNVKRGRYLDRPADAVGFYKKKRIRKAAWNYLYKIGRPALNYRFDVVEMIFNGFRLEDCRWLTSYFKMEPERDGDSGFEFE